MNTFRDATHESGVALGDKAQPLHIDILLRIWREARDEGPEATTPVRFARAVERAHGIGVRACVEGKPE
jgi:hypothetical protein